MADEGALVSVSGRKVFTDKKTGEKYSERTTTVPVNGKWYTFPTIKEDGTQMSEDEVVEYIKEKGPIDPITGEEFPSFENVDKAVEYAKARSATRLKDGYATGGEVQQMKKMYEEGGLATDGMDVDPVSGNDIPAGSNAEDVRDDVDAKLSSGEYVVPADVVKYFGVAYFEKLRDKAKSGLEGMEEDGRIGGEPAEDEKMEHTIGSDLEMMDGYATGGLVPGADVNGIIDRVKAAAMKDPSVSNLLKSKGIFIQAPEQGQAAVAPAVAGQATPQKFAEGGTVGSPDFTAYKSEDYKASMDPYAHTPGFSIAAGTPVPTSGVCPTGYRLDPNTQTCVPITGDVSDSTSAAEVDTGIKTEQQLRQERMDAGPGPEDMEKDPNGWMGKYDYSNPETLAEQTMTTLGKGPEKTGVAGMLSKGLESLVGKIGGGVLGKAINAGKYGEAMANAAVARAQGNVAQANAIEAAAAAFAKENSVNPKGLFNNAKSLTANALESLGLTGATPASTSRSSVSTASSGRPGQAPSSSRADYGAIAKGYRSQGTNVGDRIASYAEEAARTGGTIADVSRTGPGGYGQGAGEGQASGGGQQGGTGSVGASGNDGMGNGVSGTGDGAAGAATGGQGDQGQGSGWGGMNKGGLVKPRSKAKPTPKKETKSNKKGLGRK